MKFSNFSLLFMVFMSCSSLAMDEVRTPISSLPFTIDQPGFYYLTEGLEDPTGTGGIDIEVGDVVLDLMGYALDGIGVADYGVEITGGSNITIANGIIKNFGLAGIYNIDIGARSFVLENIDVVDNGSLGNDFYTHAGIAITGSNHRVTGCTVRGSGSNGMVVGTAATIGNNAVMGNGGIGIRSSTGSVLTHNRAFSNQSDGIHVHTGSTAINNVAWGNDARGINAWDGTTLIKNSVSQNSTGIAAAASSTVNFNTSTKNTYAGISVGDKNTVVGNTVADNGDRGLIVRNDSLLRGNTVTHSVGYGIHVLGENTVLRENHVAVVKENNNEASVCIYFASDDNVAAGNTATGCYTPFGGSVPPAARFIENIGW